MDRYFPFAMSVLVLTTGACSRQGPVEPSSVGTTGRSALTATPSSAASPNQQLVFQDRAGAGFGTFAGRNTPFGFWIWCQSKSNNAYGTDCAGSVYFYELRIVAGVDGEVTSFSQSGNTVSFTVTVNSIPNTSISNCVFSFSGNVTQGASNSVSLSCGSPSGSGTDSKVAVQLAPAT